MDLVEDQCGTDDWVPLVLLGLKPWALSGDLEPRQWPRMDVHFPCRPRFSLDHQLGWIPAFQ